MKPETQWMEFKEDWSEEAELVWLTTPRTEQRVMVYRAVFIYLVLVIGLGATISLLGGNPLAYGWFMPKILFYIVGLALIVALANSQLQDSGQSWASLMTAPTHHPARQVKREAKR